MGLFTFGRNKPKEKKKRGLNHLKTLIKIAKLKGNLTEEETTFIYKKGNKFGLENSDIDALIEKVKASDDVPKSHMKRYSQLFNLMEIIRLNSLPPTIKQMDYCKETAIRLGYDLAILDEIELTLKMKMKKTG